MAAHGPGAELTAWFQTPPGRYMLDWEQARFDEAVANLFGFHALQLGLPELQTLHANRMPHRWLALPEPLLPDSGPSEARVDLMTHAAALPFTEQSLDLLALPHTLELSADPHAVLREVQRVLVPEGRVVITGLNPLSLWGWRQWRAHAAARVGLGQTRCGRLFLPEAGEFIGPRRRRDWLRLLSFEVESVQLGCYRPAMRSEAWLHRWRGMDPLGQRWWPFAGAVYCMVAVKRVRGMHLLGPAWKPRPSAVAVPAALARRNDTGAT